MTWTGISCKSQLHSEHQTIYALWDKINQMSRVFNHKDKTSHEHGNKPLQMSDKPIYIGWTKPLHMADKLHMIEKPLHMVNKPHTTKTCFSREDIKKEKH